MRKIVPLKITISQPCQENWGMMEQKDKGRFCQQCQKTIVDFSLLSDEALYQYFKTNGAISCGRFHNDQLNKIINPPAAKRFRLEKFYKAAATLFAFLSMKYAGATDKKEKINIEINPFNKSTQHFLPDEVTITGMVKDQYNQPVENASITFAGEIIATSGKDGKFSFTLDTKKYEAGKYFLLLVSYPGMNTVVRNYNLAMSSTSYDITLVPPLNMREDPAHTMGIFVQDLFQTITLTSIPTSKLLTKDMKDSLDQAASRMRNFPEVIVNIITYPKNNAAKAALKKQQEAIQKYMVDEQGISEDRFRQIFGTYSPEKKNKIILEGATNY
ncbi:MAG: carboxypeptidase-like regulatory domain-containing protein [Chitinophagaceae bacterium]